MYDELPNQTLIAAYEEHRARGAIIASARRWRVHVGRYLHFACVKDLGELSTAERMLESYSAVAISSGVNASLRTWIAKVRLTLALHCFLSQSSSLKTMLSAVAVKLTEMVTSGTRLCLSFQLDLSRVYGPGREVVMAELGMRLCRWKW